MKLFFRILIPVLGFVAIVESQSCPPDWVLHNSKCYYVTKNGAHERLTWHGARDYCREHNGELASIHDEGEQNFIKDLAETNGFSGAFWIGLNQLVTRNGVWEWSDGTTDSFDDWGPDEPSTGNLEMCTASIVSNSDSENAPGVQGEWQRLTGQNVIKGLVSRPSEADGKDVFNFGQVFDYKHDECERRCSAQAGCVAYTQFASWYHDFNFYVSCMGRSNTHDVMEPDADALSGIKELKPPGLWYSRNCGYRIGVACKRDTSISLPPIATTIAPGYCPQGYIEVGNKCFLMKTGTPNDGLTWHEALAECRRAGRFNNLASISTPQENAALTAQLQNMSFGYWIGFHRGADTPDWVWADNEDTVYSNWHPGTPEDNKGDCAELWNNRYPGTWNDHHCTDKRGYICEKYKDGQTNNPPATTPHSCNGGYVPYWYGCYKVSSSTTSWSQAETTCKNDGGHLASVYSEAENSALMFYASQQNTFPIWLGMEKGTDGEYRWSDGWAVHYTNWAPDQPSGEGDCVAMIPDGQWQELPCTGAHRSLCKKTDAPAYTTPTPRPGVCPSDDWLEFGGHCYFFGTVKSDGEDSVLKTWEDANDRCRGMAGKTHIGHLASIHSDAENNFIFKELQQRSDDGANIWMTWIGLEQESESGYKWVDGSPVQYTKWVPDHRPGQGKSCVQMHVQLWQGLWQVETCDELKFFVCKAIKAPVTEAPSLPPSAKGKCPSGDWLTFQDQCLLFNKDETQLHHNSTEYCKSLHAEGNLISIHSEAENWMVREKYRQGVLPWGWIGLYRKPGDPISEWNWPDGSPVDYVNWEPGEPNDFTGREFCAEMDVTVGQWNDVDCDLQRMYGCKAPKEVQDGLGGGAIFGIIVAVLVLVGGLGALAIFIIVPYMKQNNLLEKLPWASSSSRAASGVENPNYDTPSTLPYKNFENDYENPNEFAPPGFDTPDSNGSVA